MEPIEAYIVGRVKLGSPSDTEDPETRAKILLETFQEVTSIDIITGEWDLLVKFKVASMEEYYHVAWGIAKHLERGWGALVAKKVSRAGS